MGVTVRQPKDKPHLGYFVFVAHKGKRWSQHIGDKKTAEETAKKIRREIALGQFQPLQQAHDGPTLTTTFMHWLDTHIKPWRKPATYSNYEIAWRKWIAPQLGKKAVAEITKDEIRTLVAGWKEAGLTRSSIKAMLAPLSACLAQAVEDRLIPSNPAAKVLPKQRGEGKGHKGVALKQDQLRHLLEVCRAQFPQWYPLVLLWARTGLRLSEALALRWGDVGFERHAIFVRRTLSYRSTEKETTPKGGRREELVDMSAQLAAVLRAIRPADATDATLVFPSEVGTPMNPSNFRNRVWTKLFIKAGLPKVRIHDLRHTVATLLLEKGEPLQYVQQQLRHRSIRTTVDEYGHLEPGYNRRAVDKLDDGDSEQRADSVQ